MRFSKFHIRKQKLDNKKSYCTKLGIRVQCSNMFRKWLLTLRLPTADVSKRQVCVIYGNIELSARKKNVKVNGKRKHWRWKSGQQWCISFRATRGTRSSSVLKAQLTSTPSGTSKRVVVYTSVASHSELPQTSPKQWCAQHKHSVKINLRKNITMQSSNVWHLSQQMLNPVK